VFIGIAGFVMLAETIAMHVIRCCHVSPKPEHPSKRLMFELSHSARERVDTDLVIETDVRHEYTDDFKALTKEFYLSF
jgi:tRNA1Val (adenine37-N6)-methyltransferase